MPPTIEPALTPAKNETCPWYQPLCKVTPVSKYLAMVIFIALPFIGGYIGYQLAGEKATEVFTPVVSVVPETQEIVPAQASNTSTTTSLKYVTSFDMVNEYWDNSVNFTAYTEIQNITLADQNLSSVMRKPFLTLVASTSDVLFLTAHCFKDTECTYSGLYVYDTATNVLREMSISKFYNETEFGAAQSPDKNTIVVTKQTATSTSLYAINLLTDSYKLIKTFELSSKITFCLGMGCTIEATWIDDETFNVVLYNSQNPMTLSTSSEQYSI